MCDLEIELRVRAPETGLDRFDGDGIGPVPVPLSPDRGGPGEPGPARAMLSGGTDFHASR